MSTIHDVDVDLATFCGRIGNLYGRYGLCPPFALHAAAQGWMAQEIPLSHCVDVIEHFLSRHAGSCYSRSGDWNFAWLNSPDPDKLVRALICEATTAGLNRARRHDWLEGQRAREPHQRPARREVFTAGPPTSVPKPASCEPGRVGLRQKAVGAVSPVRDTRSAFSARPPAAAQRSQVVRPDATINPEEDRYGCRFATSRTRPRRTTSR